MPGGTLVREYESFSDVTFLRERLRSGAADIAEVGCATGEFFRYLRLQHPEAKYRGFDVSEPAVRRALDKYPGGRFTVVGPDVAELAAAVCREGVPDVLYCKDVMHHQVRPMEFLDALLSIPRDSLILRCRTRDVGPTVWDPEQSCQYHYDGWMPYIVTHLDELIAHIQTRLPQAEIRILRNHLVLGGVQARYLPRECYLPPTGTAETAVVVLLRSSSAGKVTIENVKDSKPLYTVFDRAWFAKARIARMFKG